MAGFRLDMDIIRSVLCQFWSSGARLVGYDVDYEPIARIVGIFGERGRGQGRSLTQCAVMQFATHRAICATPFKWGNSASPSSLLLPVLDARPPGRHLASGSG